MEFLQGNWFSILVIGAYVIERVVTWAKKDAQAESLAKKVEDSDGKMTAAVKAIDVKMDEYLEAMSEHIKAFNLHVADTDMHITPMLIELLKERHDYSKNEFANTRTDIQRVETMLSSMMK
jgi:hypothetical protein